jgi:glycosyltransferase involved in cell wall biosynthesis
VKVSVITVCYNSEKHIACAIESVINQTYNNIEYIIIDGGSKDNTINIVKSYGSKISKFISEPDNGIYDAMNKGLMMATGDFLAILNSDDFYINNRVIEIVVNELTKQQTDSIYADLIYVDEHDSNKQVRYWKSNPFVNGSFFKGWHPAHPTFIVKNEIYEKFGYFNLNFRLAADFELMLRFLEKNQISTCYLPEAIIKMRLGGTTNKSVKNIINQNIECYHAFNENGLNASIFYSLYRIVPKILQYFKK